MAAGHLAKLCTCILSLLPVIYTLSPCTEDNFGEFITACDPETQQKKIVYYVNKNCDLDSNKSAPLPKPIENLPCFCQPGYGLQSKNSTKCTPCAKGYYSHGGELIDDWSDWNTTKSKGVPGLAYGVDTYCSDFLSGKTCSAWRPSADFSYLLSGEFKNSTQLRCFEQSMLVISRMFLLPGQQNKISFEYKVDGASCRKGSRSCSQGLHFYVNEELKLKSDTQFSWKKLEVSLKPGATRLKFVYHKSCTREAILDVAYIRHLSMVGTDSGQGLTAKAVKCTACNSGSYADTEGSTECTKCVQNEFQPKQGQEKCEKCGVDQFSRIGETKCYDLPDCQKKDYFIKPKPIETCVKNGSTDVYVREQVRGLPSWPVRPCKPDKSMQVKQPKVQCRCLAGFAMTTGGKKINCEKCEVGKYSDGFMKECKTCPAGHAAIPGFFLDSFTEDRIPGVIKQNCSGALCQAKDNQYWIPRGDYMATRRIAGNFEVTLDFQDIEVDYHDAKVTFNCSIDCRISADGKRLAKHDHCFLRFVIQKWNETSQSYRSILEQDCVSKYRQKLRDGTMMNHVYPVPDPGRYSFRSLFHHEDEGNYSLLSYEARVYHFDVTGAKQGSAQKCVKCPAGEYLTKTGAFCLKCPEGKYSKEGSVECLDCPDNSFSDKEGSGGCTKCGAGTTSNHNKTGCDYNKCQFKYGEHVYDLSPLRVVDGPMYKVRTYRPKSKYFFPLYYYVNVCSLKHDNSSCATMKRVEDKKRKGTTVRKQVLIKTMACKRWSFDENHSYSIGEVMNFLPWKGNETNGLLLNLTGGYRCWNKGNKAYQTPYTTILMKCEPDIDIGYPEPLNNGTAVERNCVFELQWRTRYACRLCHPVNDYNQIVGRCQKGQQRVTYVRKTNCRSVSTTKKVFMKTQLCTENEKNTLTATAKEDDDTPLIVAIVIAVLVIVILIVFVIYYARRNRYLRGRLFVPGKSFSKVQEEDEDELVDNMG